MKFPDLNIIKEVDNTQKISDYKTFLLCQLDWSSVDEYKKSKHISWIYNFVEVENQFDKKALDDIISDIDWEEHNYPTFYKSVYKEFELIKIPKTYYDEIIHFRDLSIKEWSKQRPFDTNIREKCLEPAISAIDTFFHLIYDCAFMFEFRGSQNIDIIKSLWLYRFWKHQTGSGMLISRSTKDLERHLKYNKILNDLKLVLDSNNTYTQIYNLDYYRQLLTNRSIVIRRESKINDLIDV
jgi:hypothetical protein